MHDNSVVDSNFIEVLLELGEIPLTCCFFTIAVLLLVSTFALDILFVLFVDRVVSQVDVLLVYRFGVVRVLLGGETD